MNRFRLPIICILLLFLLTGQANAIAPDQNDVLEEQKKAYGMEELEQSIPDEASAIWGDVTVDDAADTDGLLNKLLSYLGINFGEIFRNALKNVCQIMLVCFLTAAFQTFPYKNGPSELTGTIGAMSAAILGAAQTYACIPLGEEILSKLNDLSGKVLPAVCAAATAGGAVTSAGAKYAAASLALNLYGTIAVKALLPGLYLFTALVLAANVLQNEMLLSIVSLLKTILRGMMTAFAMLFTTYLMLTGILKGTADAAAAKAAKTAISACLPVVGGIIGNAADLMVSGAAILCSGAGVLGLFCVLAICALPYLSLSIHYLVYRCMSAFSSSVSDKRISGLLRGLSDVYATLLGIVGTVSFILFTAIISLMRAVNV